MFLSRKRLIDLTQNPNMLLHLPDASTHPLELGTSASQNALGGEVGRRL